MMLRFPSLARVPEPKELTVFREANWLTPVEIFSDYNPRPDMLHNFEHSSNTLITIHDRGIFVTGSGTGVGKTLVTTSMLRLLTKRGAKVMGLKPVISGFNAGDVECDTIQILRSQNMEVNDDRINKISPWRLKAPLSPNMAAERDGIKLSAEEIADWCIERIAAEKPDIAIIEGAGGVLVPLNNHETMLDVMVRLNIPVILVTGSYLGTISHTLTSYEVIKSRGLKVSCIVISESPESPVPVQETLETIMQFTQAKIHLLPRIPVSEDKWVKGAELLAGMKL